MTAIREALTCPNIDAPMHTALGCTWCAHTTAALAELDALDAVAEAARHYMNGTDPDGRIHLFEAVVRLAEVRDGQTPASGCTSVRDEAIAPARHRPTSAASPEGKGGPEAGVCPCRVHGDPDGDCGERCAP